MKSLKFEICSKCSTLRPKYTGKKALYEEILQRAFFRKILQSFRIRCQNPIWATGGANFEWFRCQREIWKSWIFPKFGICQGQARTQNVLHRSPKSYFSETLIVFAKIIYWSQGHLTQNDERMSIFVKSWKSADFDQKFQNFVIFLDFWAEKRSFQSLLMMVIQIHDFRDLCCFLRIQALKCILATGGAHLSNFPGFVNFQIFDGIGRWSSTGVLRVLPRSLKLSDSDSTDKIGLIMYWCHVDWAYSHWAQRLILSVTKPYVFVDLRAL